MVYQYVAYTEGGEVVSGRLQAASEQAATDLLGYAGYRVIHLKPFIPFLSLDKLLLRLSSVKPSEIVLLYRQLALLLESGTSIITSLELLHKQVANRTLKKSLEEVFSDLRGGSQLSAAIARHPKIFPPICSQSLSIGEQTGNLETMLRQTADYMEKEIVNTKSIKGALMYPIFTLLVAVISMGVVVFFVLPAFENLYSSFGAELPTLTRILMDIGGSLRSNGLYIMSALFILTTLAFAYSKTPRGRFTLDRVLLVLPLLGRINHLKELARCCRSISLLFRAGLPLTELVPHVIRGSGNRVIVQALTDLNRDMLKGEGLSQPMAKSALFLPMMVQMVKVGEETGNLDVVLLAVAQSYEVESEDRLRSLVGFIQPAMTIIIALAVGFVAMSLVSAMYSIYGEAF